MMILRDVVMPIQSSFFTLWAEGSACNNNITDHLLSVAWSAGGISKPLQYHDMIAVYRHALKRLSVAHGVAGTKSDKRDSDGRMVFLLQMLGKCVDALKREWIDKGGRPPPLPPVLCHMDLQPQNLAFCRNGETQYHDFNVNQVQTRTAMGCHVAAVMDWEEACYADPRFELLLICRKVLANRKQSEKVWQSYSNHVQKLGSLLSARSGNQLQWEVGPLEPWLKLETVHSLCTLMLQAMGLLGGGRSPWETKPDLWEKIDRERQRLLQMGWTFCNFVEDVE